MTKPDPTTISFDELRRFREQDRARQVANGFGEGDPAKNGEFSVLKALAPQLGCYVDVGANNGAFVREAAAAGVRELFAFEPNPALSAGLAASGAVVIQKAVSDQPGSAAIFIHRTDDTVSSLAVRQDMMPSFTANMQPVDVEITTLDLHADKILAHAAHGLFLKIDVEGHELSVMRGSRALLEAVPAAVVLFEYSSAWELYGHTVKKAFHLLDQLGFRVFRVLPMGLEHLRFYTADMETTGYCNYLAVRGLTFDRIFAREQLPSPTHVANDVYLFGEGGARPVSSAT